MSQFHVAILGATGAVGQKMGELLVSRRFPVASLRVFASPRSVGQSIAVAGRNVAVEPLGREAFRGIDVVLSSTPSAVSTEWAPVAAAQGAIVIDNSSAWRMDPQVPLVVPEVNATALDVIPKGIVANPNCSTIQMLVALKPLHDAGRIRRIIVSTYQASSGKGATGLTELDGQIRALGQGREPEPARAHAARLAGNVLPHDWKLSDDGYSEEEWKMVRETRKILGDDSIAVSPTTVRVPVRTGHSESIYLELERPLTVDRAREILRGAPGVVVEDDYAGKRIPTPLEVEGRDEVFVGRLRRDPANPNALLLWVVADNLRKGAATNAVQIAEVLASKGRLGRRS